MTAKEKYETYKNSVEPTNISVDSLIPTYSEFILPTQECRAGVFAKGLYLDDEEFYIDSLQALEQGNQNIIFLINEVNAILNEYFGYGRDEQKRNEFNQNLKDGHSIKEYKGQNAAVCFERSLMAHNLFKLLGLDSTLMVQRKHMYIMIKTAKSIIIYDPTNQISFSMGEERFGFPGFVVIPKEKAEGFLYGDESVELNDEFLRKVFPNAENISVPEQSYTGRNMPKPENEKEVER